MALHVIDKREFVANSYRLWNDQWLLLAAGDFALGEYNAMTVAWGSLGCMWNVPFAQVVVRPVRHTYKFMERFGSFTLSVFPEQHKDALLELGSKSGRDGDKIAEAGLTPVASAAVASPGFHEAELIIECRKIYWQDMKPEQFLEPGIMGHYPNKDFHRIYFGEIQAIRGTDAYRGKS